MKFQVPQFIGIEDKIFGPLTAKQFLYVGAAAGIGFTFFKLIPSKIIAIILGAPIVGLFLALAFYKYNDQPFIKTVENGFKYFTNSRMFIWKKIPKTPKEIEKKQEETVMDQVLPKLSDSKLRDLSWSLDIKEKIED
ncbi:MAG TPA: PrgI family protein [Candidatus Paceibacterota bacterium]|nr:PrgI family protein [Candidatus Paceibacterota bacterium]